MTAICDEQSFRDEARAELIGMFAQRCGSIPPEFLAEHVLAIYPCDEWPVLRDAARAIIQRFETGRADQLVVKSRPKKGWRGGYTTGRKRAQPRPYRTQVPSLDPLRIPCDCPDYLRNGLGSCKHGLAVLASLASKKRTFERALTWTGTPATAWWDPIRPLEGPGDWLAGVRTEDAPEGLEVPQIGSSRRRLLEELQRIVKHQRTHRDPALRARIARELEHRSRVDALACPKRERSRALRSFRLSPYPYQRATLDKFLQAGGRLLLADDMGLGKTVQASAVAHLLHHTKKLRRILVLAPASLKSQWVREWARATDVPVLPVEGTPEDRAELYRRTKAGALVANYEQVFRDLELMQSWKPQLVILDEAQRTKNWATKTARPALDVVAQHAARGRQRLRPARFEELWPVLEGQPPSERRVASLAMPKLDRLHDLIEGLVVEQGRRVIVFSQWRRALRLVRWRIEPMLRAAGVRAAMFTGAESQKRRTHNIVDFHDDPSCRVLLCTDAGGVGLNLQRAANCCVNFEMPWNPAVLEQRIARIHRLGQTDPIDVFNLLSEGSIESRIAASVATKKAMFDGLFDGTADEVMFDSSGSFLSAVSAVSELVDVPSSDEPDGEEEEVFDDPSDAPSAPDDAPPPDRPAPAVRAMPPGPEQLRSMFAQLSVQRRDDGGIKLEAPPEAARTLSALFAGMSIVTPRPRPTTRPPAAWRAGRSPIATTGSARTGSRADPAAKARPRGASRRAMTPCTRAASTRTRSCTPSSRGATAPSSTRASPPCWAAAGSSTCPTTLSGRRSMAPLAVRSRGSSTRSPPSSSQPPTRCIPSRPSRGCCRPSGRTTSPPWPLASTSSTWTTSPTCTKVPSAAASMPSAQRSPNARCRRPLRRRRHRAPRQLRERLL